MSTLFLVVAESKNIWLEDKEAIKHEIVGFYENLLGSEHQYDSRGRGILESVLSRRLSVEEGAAMIGEFSAEEIEMLELMVLTSMLDARR